MTSEMLESEPFINIADYARAARSKLSKHVLDYFEGGALDEITLRENTAGWERLKLYYRVLAGVGKRDHDHDGPRSTDLDADRGRADRVS